MRHGISVLFFIFSSMLLGFVFGEDIQSVPLQYISFSAVPDLPFAGRLLTYRAGSNVVGGEDLSKIGSVNTTGDTCPGESECSFMSNCPTLRRIQPSTRCEVSLNPSGGVASSIRLPGGTCCRKSRQSSPSDTNAPLKPSPSPVPTTGSSPVLSAAISTAAFGTWGGADLTSEDLTPRIRKSGHLVNFVAPPNGQLQYNNGGKSPLVLLAPGEDSKMSFLPGEAPFVKQKHGSALQGGRDSSLLSGPTTTQNGPSSVNGENASQFFINLSNALPTMTTTTRPIGGMEISHAVEIGAQEKNNILQNQPLTQQQPLPQQVVPPRFEQPQQSNIQPQQQQEAVAFQPPPVPQNFQPPQSPVPTLTSQTSLTSPIQQPFQQPQNLANPYPQGPFQGPQQPQQPQYFPQPNGVGPQTSQQQQQQQQQQFMIPSQQQQQNNVVYQQLPQAPPPQQQFMPASPIYNQQTQNFSPQMAIPVMQSYGLNSNQNQPPNTNFVPFQQQQIPQPQSQASFMQQQPQVTFMQQRPPNQIQIMQNLSNFQQPLLPSRASVTPQEPLKPAPIPLFSSFSAIPASPSTTFCGVRDPNLSSRSGRILGGRPSEFGAWPWMAVITSSKRLRCGATILNEQFLITAAHCVYKNFQYGYYQDLAIRIGIFSMDEDEVGPYAPQEVRIYQVYVHPFFNATQSSYDIALIQVATPIIFRPHIKPVCLPNSEHLGETGTVLGWGKRKESDDRSNLPMVLQEVNLPILYPWQCILELKSNKIYEDIGPQFVCAGGRPNQDACRGDSGGPLLALSDGQYWEMIGIVSKGYGCGKENVPGIYTNIFFLKDWIESTVSANWNIFPGQFGSRERSSYYR